MPDVVTPPAPDASFEDHVTWARTTPLSSAAGVSGADGSAGPIVAAPVEEEAPPWDYRALSTLLATSGRGRVLDLGDVVGQSEGSGAETDDGLLPFPDGHAAVVLGRHAPFDPDEVLRVLEPGGVFLTEQVGSRDGVRVNAALGAELTWDPDSVTLDAAVEVLRDAGFVLDVAREHDGERHFHDLGSLLWHLRREPWQVPELATTSPDAVARFEAPLRALHLHFSGGHEFVDEAPRFLVVARRPFAAAE